MNRDPFGPNVWADDAEFHISTSAQNRPFTDQVVVDIPLEIENNQPIHQSPTTDLYHSFNILNNGQPIPSPVYSSHATHDSYFSKSSRNIQCCPPKINFKTFFRLSVTDDQKKTLLILLLQFLLCCILWNFSVGNYILYPFQLFSVLFHEFGHAFMCWMTGGSVKNIRIGPRADGVTVTTGGMYCLILPSGYLGSSLMGAFMLYCGFSAKASFFASFFIDGCCIVTLFFYYDTFTFILTILTLLAFLSLTYYDYMKRRGSLRYAILMIGTIASFISIWDILEDIVIRSVSESDAYKFATVCLYSPSMVVGFIWWIFSLLFISLSLILALKSFPSSSTF